MFVIEQKRKYSFNLFCGSVPPNNDFISLAPKVWYYTKGFPVRSGEMQNGSKWLLIGWVLGGKDIEELVKEMQTNKSEGIFKADGQFVFIIYFPHSQTIILFRDRMGILPLVHVSDEKSTIVSSWIADAARCVSLKTNKSEELLCQWPVYRMVFYPNTPIDRVMSLPTGCSLRIKQEKVEKIEHPMNWCSDNKFKNTKGAAEYLGKRLSRSVCERLRISENSLIGVWLSGGLDSSLLVALMREHYNGKIKTVFVTFEDYERNYSKYARHVAQLYDTDHDEYALDVHDFLSNWSETIYRIEAPINHPGTIGQAYALKKLNGSVKICFDGQSADTVFGGPYWSLLLIFSMVGSNILSDGLQRRLYNAAKIIDEKRIFSKIFKKSLIAFSTSIRNYLHSENAFSDKNIVDLVFGEGRWEKTVEFCKSKIGKNIYEDLFYFLNMNWNIPDGIIPEIKLGFSHGVIFFYPFLDNQLLVDAGRLTFFQRYNLLNKKIVLKKYAEKYFNRDFIYKPKEGFGVPLAKWYTTQEFEKYLKLPLEERSLKRGWWNEKELKKIIEYHQAGMGTDETAESIPWITINLELWARICLEGDSPDLYKIPS